MFKYNTVMVSSCEKSATKDAPLITLASLKGKDEILFNMEAEWRLCWHFVIGINLVEFEGGKEIYSIPVQ